MMKFLSYKGYSSDARSQVVMRDDNHTDPRGPFWPTGKNILAAMHWLVSEPGTVSQAQWAEWYLRASTRRLISPATPIQVCELY